MLANLPNELLIAIAESLYSEQDINALARTNQRFFAVLDPLLYRHNASHSGGSALLWAATHGIPVAAKKALEAGASASGEPVRQRRVPPSPLNKASENGHVEIVDMLLRTGQVDTKRKDRDGRAALALAAGYGYAEIVDILLRYDGVEVEKKDREGQTALALAACYGNADAVGMLLRSGRVDVEQRDQRHRTPILLAAEGDHADVVRLLLEYGADADAQCRRGDTPLTYACGYGWSAEVVELLLGTGRVDVDHRNNDGSTPFLRAVGSGHVGAVRLLLNLPGVDTLARSNSGWTALHCLASRAHRPCHCVECEVNWAAVVESDDIVQLLRRSDRGFDVSVRDSEGRTALSYAAEYDWLALGELLLESGSDEVDLKDNYGMSPLEIAMYEGYDEFARMLQRALDGRLMGQYWDGYIDYMATAVRQ